MSKSSEPTKAFLKGNLGSLKALIGDTMVPSERAKVAPLESLGGVTKIEQLLGSSDKIMFSI